MKKLLLLMAALVLAASLVVPMAVPAAADPLHPPLYAGAGGTLDIGRLNIWNDGETLYVEFEILESGWLLEKTDVHVATSLAGIPQANGNPKVGKFDYSEPHGVVTKYTYAIDRSGWSVGTELYIAAHADVGYYSDGIRCREETAWGGCWGHQFPGRNWAVYSVYYVQ